MSLILHAAVQSDVGLVRTNNEDSAYAGRRLFVVADGMGGLPAGELASDILIQALVPLDEGPEAADPLESLRASVEAANERIRTTAESDAAREGMGTTVTALLAAQDRLALLHVGDSRCYLHRQGELTQLSKDDTFVQSLVDQGVLTAEDARRHPQRALVTQAVQGHSYRPWGAVLSPYPGDRFLLCSDGLSDYVADDAIAQTLTANSEPRGCAEALVKRTLQAGAPDNVTAVVVDVVGAGVPPT